MRMNPLETVRIRIADFQEVFAFPAFATYQAGNLVMTIGFWMQRIAVGWVTWEITGSEIWLGIVAFCELFPSILTALWGGSLADRHAAPHIMFWGQLASATISVALAVLHFTGSLTPVGMAAMMAMLGAVSGVLLPARLSMARHLAPAALLPLALAVNSASFNLSRFAGPALAGGLLVIGSAGVVFAVSALGFLCLAVALNRIRNVPGQGASRASEPVRLRQVLHDLRQLPQTLSVLLLQCAQGFLIRPATELFPAYAEVSFGRGEMGLGLLNAALGVGAILGALSMSKSRSGNAALRQIFQSAVAFAISMVFFALSGSFWLALALLLAHGATMSSSNIAALTYVQIETPANRLGRVLSLYTIIFRVAPAAGALFYGSMAELVGLRATGVSFAVVGLIVTLLLWRWATHPIEDSA